MTKHDDLSSPVSATTGFQPVTALSAIGSQLGGIGSGVTRQESSVLATLKPFDTDRRVADALQHISGARPTFRRRTMFPENGPTYQVAEAVFWTCNEDQQREAVKAVEFSLRSAPEELIAKALYELRVVTRGRANRDAGDDEAEAIIFIERLRQFPADIVLDTLKNWHTRSDGQWWPTWHDLHKAIEPQATARRMLADHIRSGACLAKPKTAETERDDSPEGVAARQAFIERHKGKLNYPKPSKGMTPEEFEAWEDRQKRAIASEGLPKLSDEARALFREQAERAVPSHAEQFDEWERSTQPRTGKERAA